jgi:activator of 2-hydroxyglutaryl-CoA dehydratase
VILGGDDLLSAAVVPTGWSPRDAGRQVFAAALQKAGLAASDVAREGGTGYGRVALDFLDQAVTEITCHAVGAYRLFPANDAVIDIGGQDSKAIKVGPGGKSRTSS